MAAQRTFLAIAYDRSNAAVAGLRLAVSPPPYRYYAYRSVAGPSAPW